MVASYYAHAYCKAVGTVRIWCVTARHRHILGVHQRIVKLYPTGKGPIKREEVVTTYLVTHACDNHQSEAEAEDKIVGCTMQQ
jgi:hypothetical protein